ncbi:cupin domain-containing protein [Streptosporangium soli]|nr:cupin domain-containing protein [Streptosporangium sp. KLBMP 9127]
MSVTHSTEARRTETPNGVMTTLASPTQGGASQSLWRVDFAPGREGPLHACDSEQVWTLLTGSAVVELGGDRFTLTTGDTVVMPADVPRQMFSDPLTGFSAIVTGPGTSEVYNPGGVSAADAGELAPKDAARIVPPWVA